MQEQDNFGKFVIDFYNYAAKRIKNGGAPDSSACDKIITIHHNQLLRQQLLNIELKQDWPAMLTDNYCYFMYVYLISKYNGDSLKQEQLIEIMLIMREGQSTLESVLLSFSYSHDKQQFTTDDS